MNSAFVIGKFLSAIWKPNTHIKSNRFPYAWKGQNIPYFLSYVACSHVIKVQRLHKLFSPTEIILVFLYWNNVKDWWSTERNLWKQSWIPLTLSFSALLTNQYLCLISAHQPSPFILIQWINATILSLIFIIMIYGNSSFSVACS